MYWYETGWGGSMAIKTEFLRKSDLRQRLVHAFGEDNTATRCARDYGYRMAFAPSLIMVNRENCSVKGLFGFLERQLLSVRLHSPWWWVVVGHGVTMTGVLGLCCLGGAVAAATASWSAAAWLGIALASYWASLLVMVLPLEWCVRRIVPRGEAIRGLGSAGLARRRPWRSRWPKSCISPRCSQHYLPAPIVGTACAIGLRPHDGPRGRRPRGKQRKAESQRPRGDFCRC